MTTCMPAARADLTPFGASSKARHLLASGTGENLWRQISKASGAGFPFFTAGSLPHLTMWRKFFMNSVWFFPVFKSKASLLEPVVIAEFELGWKRTVCLTDRNIVLFEMVDESLNSGKKNAVWEHFWVLLWNVFDPTFGRELIFQVQFFQQDRGGFERLSSH